MFLFIGPGRTFIYMIWCLFTALNAYFSTPVYFNRIHAEFFHYFSFHAVKPFTRDWVTHGGLRKKYGVQPIARGINECMKIHVFILYGMYRLCCDQIP